MLLSLYLAVLDDQSKEEQFIDVYNTYKRLVYHTAYKIMGDSYLAEDVLQEVFLYVAKNFSKIHRENCHELAAYLVSCSRSRAYDMLRKQREEPLEEVPDAPDDAPVPDDAVVSTDNIEHLTELIGQMKPMYRDPLRLLAMGYTNREIAKSLGLTDEVVRMRLFRGRKLKNNFLQHRHHIGHFLSVHPYYKGIDYYLARMSNIICTPAVLQLREFL